MRIASLLGLTITLVILGSGSLAIATTGGLIETYEKITMDTEDDLGGTIGFEAGDLFGYKSTNMGDIDGNGAEDFATIAFHDNTYFGNAYLVLMNTDSSVKDSHELSNCSNIAGQQETRTFGESLDYLGVINGKHILLISDYWFGSIYALSIDPTNYTHTCYLLEDADGYGAEASNYVFRSTVDGNYDLGWSMTVVGDVATDGDTSTIPDLIVSAGGNTRHDADDPNAVYPPNILDNDMYRLELSVNSTNHLKVTDYLIDDSRFPNTWGDRLFENAVITDFDSSSTITKLVLGEPRDSATNPHFNGINGYVHVTTILNPANSFLNVKTLEFANLEVAINQTGTPHFGIGLANMGDLDSNGIDDIAVGIEFLDIGGTSTGAVAIIFLDNQGKAEKISIIANGDNEPYVLSSGDYFGKGLESIDTDGDGFPELVASAHQDDTGGSNAGAVYVMTFNQNNLNGLSYDMTPTPVHFSPTTDNFYTQFSSFVNYAYAVESPSFGLIELPFTSTIIQVNDVTTIQKINFDPSSIVEEPTYCGGLTIDELIASGNYNVIDNRDGSLGSKVKGTNGDDLMIASDNGDHMKGKKGDDCMIGGAGNDILKGKKGNDEIYGNGGDDTLRGNKGIDKLYGGLGNDKLFAGKDNDFLYGNEGDDLLDGKKGTDTCDGGLGTNTLKRCEL